MDTVRLGLVGVGWFGGVLAESARASGAAEVVACFARSPDARAAFAEHHGCRPVDDLDALLGDPEVEGVLLATPHSTHADQAVRAAEAGKHVFVEKPLTLTVADAKRVGEAADRAGVRVQVGHNRRRQPANRRIKAMVDGGELGTVLQLEGVHTAAGGHKPDLPAWRKDADECPFGGMTALGVHTVDTFHHFVGPAERVVAFSKQVAGFTDLDEATSVVLEYASGPVGTITTTYFSAPVVSLGVFGSEGAAWNEEDGAQLFTQARTEGARTRLDVEPIDTIADELAEFALVVREGAAPETGVAEAIEVAAVLEAIGRSAG
ncbi:MAG TPA: Gfo/Idh/MocA family oxidoreductase, partial [Actinomycetota bacterium]|nr:Gfo/Idh/MocA family oxidoreductase [Actinomycetota bacterium]